MGHSVPILHLAHRGRDSLGFLQALAHGQSSLRAEPVAHPARALGGRASPARCRRGSLRLEDETREQARQLGGFETVEHAFEETFADHQVRLVIDRAQELTAGIEVPSLGVAEFLEDRVTSLHLIDQGPFGARGAVVGFELGVGALHDLERDVRCEVIDEVGREVVRGSKARVQIIGR